MYNSPITMFEQIAQELRDETDDAIVREVRRVGFNIDKAELGRALAYDRNQYQKGFQDGVMMAKTWRPFPDFVPDPDERVLCCTETKKGTRNCVIGYHDGPPEVEGRYLVCCNSKYPIEVGRFYINVEDERWFCCDWNDPEDIVAWMPLPEPYKGGEEEC